MMTEYKGYTFEYHHKFKKEFNKIITKHHCPTLKDDFKLLYDILTLLCKNSPASLSREMNCTFKRDVEFLEFFCKIKKIYCITFQMLLDKLYLL